MADDEGTAASGPGTGPVYDFIAQLRRMADQLDPTTGLGRSGSPSTPPSLPTFPGLAALPKLPTVPALPPPGALSAAQLSAMTSAVAAQRGSIEGLQAQLRAFDEQLQVLEQILVPLAEWSRSWADLERTVLPPGTTG